MASKRIALGIEYNGSSFNGYQMQAAGTRTVQEELERALSKVADEPVRLTCAGRTDTGVHATGQVVHLHTDVIRSEYSWVRGTTRYLPDDVTVLWAKLVDDDFHARFSATERQYQYLILNRSERPAILHRKVTWEYRPLDISLMQEAANSLVGKHDFNAYRAVGCQAKSPVRDLRELSVERYDDFVIVNARADAFLHHMIRNIAGVLCSIGAGEKSPAWAGEVLASCDRTCGGVTAPPDGLYLNKITYPEKFRIPSVRSRPWIFGL
ncbi:MAG: tRNA pseudouridine(38-40) synthase TruA [Gammaproteobacteria bacterium]|nr:tRNA pseudouridine(38-40) synthase TruA [Gammaproteobacteria bacterium]MDX2486981.1 tRNA pseudouridine(38-40) synthase TruA [Gammaproteobacteria bacterium]